MIFFTDNDGTVIKSVPSPVYQGGANTNNIYLIAPFAANLQVTVRFQLPNGVWTTPALMKSGIKSNSDMTPQGEILGVIEENTKRNYAVWSYSLPNQITQYYGTVTAQFFFYAAQGGVITASSATSFTVGRGVPAILPDTPTDDVYEAILSNLSALQEQLNNGTFAARALYAWNNTYTYGANELVYYPNEGEFGVFLKSLVADNTTEPYTDGVLNSESWQKVVDFNILNGLYGLQEELNEAINTANSAAQKAEEAVENAEKSAEESAQSASAAQSASESAANSLAEALNAAKSAEEYTEIAKQYAEFGIKINTDYQTVESLPRPGDSHYIYLIPNGSTGANGYDEYIWVEDKNDYEKIGTTEIDLTAYATKEEVNALGEQLNTNKADKNGTYPDMTVGNADNATALQTPRAIDGVMFDGTKNIAHYAICSTSSQEEIKIVTFPGINDEEFQLVVGARITVHFTTFNSVGSPSLNVNGTGAKPVVCKGRKTDLVWNSFTHITFLYDGSNWVILDGYPLADRPVGTHHIQFDGESTPASLYGGTWTLDTEYINRVLLGAGIYALGATGGSADAVLVEHGYHTPGQTYGFPDGSDNSYCLLAEKLLADGYALKFSTTRPFMLYTGDELGIRTISQGESGAGKNMMPYKVVNIWVRTA